MRFEWDDEKAQANYEKHRVSFEEAKLVFADPNRVEDYDEAHSTIDEQRYTVTGYSETDLLSVVFTIRGDEVSDPVIRIIHARFASPRLEKYYYEQNQES